MSLRSSVGGRGAPILALAGVLGLVSVVVQGQSGSAASTQNVELRAQDLPEGEGLGTARTGCLVCHGADLILQQRLARDGWAREVDKMIGWGAVIVESEKAALVDYLAVHFGVASAPRVSDRLNPTGSTLLQTRCLTCHDSRLIEQQRLTAAGWARVVEKMIGWGATVSANEKDVLVERLLMISTTVADPADGIR